ncbi:Cytochrome B561 [Rhodovastum atsumiense]|uniref:Cytochrome b n=1 Tax=Rhodovastum atsumiense TaxID=504468 RepID=A0A5M6J0S2_9PROT|nr:cytochrome b/b6 domain-containing protein [Rhodovastum atsumiense]KAA5614173.1 cytochrome b [Rhodovastum atsumiense]CAH2599029.1 Cytochrome B561 [Rhodovastum atsumiense]
MTPPAAGFAPLQRGLHWLMAALLLAMLFIGVGMVSSVSRYVALVALHKPLGILLLLLVLIRIGVRLRHGAPALPDDLPAWQKAAAGASHVVLYGLMLAMPLLGWSMLSAGGYPIVLYGPLHLPPIAPHDAGLYALLRGAHTWLAYLLFLTVLMHLGAALFHLLIRQDGVFAAMAPWPRR